MSASPAPNAAALRACETTDAGKIRLGAGLRRPPASRDATAGATTADAIAVADSGRIRLGAGLRRTARATAA